MASDEDAGDAEAVRAFQGRMTDIVARAVAAEREACAALVSRLAADHGLDPESYAWYIRNRSNTSK